MFTLRKVVVFIEDLSFLLYFVCILPTDLYILTGLRAEDQKVSPQMLTCYRPPRRWKLPHYNFCYCLRANYIFCEGFLQILHVFSVIFWRINNFAMVVMSHRMISSCFCQRIISLQYFKYIFLVALHSVKWASWLSRCFNNLIKVVLNMHVL